MRRRQRRLRQFLRHERLSVAMALAEKLQHTSRGQRFARAGEEGREEHDALRRQRPSRSSSSCTRKSPAVPGRPVWSRRGGLRRRSSSAPWSSSLTSFPWCRSWTLLGFLGGDVVVDLLRELDAPALDELVIAVPKISLDWIPQRCPRRRPRRAEQLVEVPTIISYSSLQLRNVEQTIDIPVPHDRGGRGVEEAFKVSLGDRVQQRFVEQNSSTFQFLKGRGGLGGGGLQSFSQELGSTAFYGADHADFPVPLGRVGGGGLQGFLPGQGSAASSSLTLVLRKKLGMGFFALFPGGKKVRGWVRTRGQNWVRTLIHGLRRLMPSPWRTPTTRLWRSRRRRWWWRRVLRSLCSWLSAHAGLHAVPRAPGGTASVGVCLWR